MRVMRATLSVLVGLIIASGCTPNSAAQVQPTPSIAVHTFAGGCAGTMLTDALPPAWAQGGWSQPHAPWEVPWALGTGGNAVAYLFATELVAGPSPRVDGTNNKVLWVAKGAAPSFMVEAHPLGESRPLISIAGGPSIVDLPTAGCWTFQLSWGFPGQTATSTINLAALPTGSVPAMSFQVLSARPLTLPAVVDGSACPVSPVTMLGGVAPRIGTPLRLGFGSVSGPRGGYAFNKTVLDYASATPVGNVVLRGRRLDGAGRLNFGGVDVGSAGAATVTVTDPQGSQLPFYAELHLAPDSTAVFYTYPSTTGCFGIQADSEGFSEVIVFRAT